MNAAPNAARGTPWMDDGDLVIVARDPDGSSTMFSVHRAKVYESSPVLRDVIERLAPEVQYAVADLTVKGVPCVRLPPRAKHLGTVLRMMYDVKSFKVTRMSPNMALEIEGPLKIATEYRMAAVRARLVALLESAWPRTRAQWDAVRAAQWRVREKMLDAAGALVGRPPDMCFPEPASAIRVARLYDVPSILPAAFWALALVTHGEHDFHGPFVETRRGEACGVMTARWALVSGTDMLCMLDGRRRAGSVLRNMQVTTRFVGREGAERGTPIACADAECARARSRVEMLHQDLCAMFFRSPVDVLGILNRDGFAALVNLYKLPLCASCRPELEENAHALGDDLWRRFPRLFGMKEKPQARDRGSCCLRA